MQWSYSIWYVCMVYIYVYVYIYIHIYIYTCIYTVGIYHIYDRYTCVYLRSPFPSCPGSQCVRHTYTYMHGVIECFIRTEPCMHVYMHFDFDFDFLCQCRVAHPGFVAPLHVVRGCDACPWYVLMVLKGRLGASKFDLFKL